MLCAQITASKSQIGKFKFTHADIRHFLSHFLGENYQAFFYFICPARSQFLSISVAVCQVNVQLTLLGADIISLSQCIKVAKYEASNFFMIKVICLMGPAFLILTITVVILKGEDDKKKRDWHEGNGFKEVKKALMVEGEDGLRIVLEETWLLF